MVGLHQHGGARATYEIPGGEGLLRGPAPEIPIGRQFVALKSRMQTGDDNGMRVCGPRASGQVGPMGIGFKSSTRISGRQRANLRLDQPEARNGCSNDGWQH